MLILKHSCNNSTLISALKGHFSSGLYNYMGNERKVALYPLHCADCALQNRTEPFSVQFLKMPGWPGDLPNKNQCPCSDGIHEKQTSQGTEDFQAFQNSFLLASNAGKVRKPPEQHRFSRTEFLYLEVNGICAPSLSDNASNIFLAFFKNTYTTEESSTLLKN